jgi:hypothetical protein
MQDIAVGGDNRVVRLAAKNVDGSASEILGFWFVAKQRPCRWVGDEACGSIAMKCPLKRALQYIAFGAVVVDDAQAAIRLATAAAPDGLRPS